MKLTPDIISPDGTARASRSAQSVLSDMARIYHVANADDRR